MPVDRQVVKPWDAFVNAKPDGDYAFAQSYTGIFTEGTFEAVSFHLDIDPPSLR